MGKTLERIETCGDNSQLTDFSRHGKEKSLMTPSSSPHTKYFLELEQVPTSERAFSTCSFSHNPRSRSLLDQIGSFHSMFSGIESNPCMKRVFGRSPTFYIFYILSEKIEHRT